MLAALLGSAFAPMWSIGGALAADLGDAPAVRPRAARSVVCLVPPVAGPVVEPFRRPACPYCAGHRGLTYELPDAGAGTIRNLASPIVVDGHRLGRGAPVPRLGADTDTVLNDQDQEVSAWSCASSVGR